MHKEIIGIIGAGDIGLNLAEITALKGYDVKIYNRYHEVEGKPSPYWLSKMGKIMDMNDSLQLSYCGDVTLTNNLNDLSNASFIVITAGAKRTSTEETREELAGKNAKIVESYIDFIASNLNIMYLIISNPVDFLTQYLIEKLSLKTGKQNYEIAKKIVGVSYIDTMRLKNLVKEFLKKYHPTKIDAKIEAIVIGEHGPSMVPLISSVTVDSEPLDKFATSNDIDYITEHTILRGNDIIKLTGASSVMGPAHAVMYMIDEIVNNDILNIAASVWDGKRAIGRYGEFSGNSFKNIIDINMNDKESVMLKKSEEYLDKQYEIIKKIIEE